MSKVVKRGYYQSDEKEFSGKDLVKVMTAAKDFYYLLSRGYPVKGASVFVGNHFLLSERQRVALARGVSAEEDIKIRKEKEIKDNIKDSIVNIDAFNTIITLEVALSNSLLLKSMDGTIRDLAGLRGTYRLIDKTETAIRLIGEALERKEIKKAVFYVDSPVSNSGRLKSCIEETLKDFNFEVQVEVIKEVDSTLEKLSCVISSDAIILNKCESWINLNRQIMDERFVDFRYVDFES